MERVRRYLVILVCTALVATVCLPLAGCKDTDVLTQLIQDQIIGEIDYSADPSYQDADDAQAATDNSRVEGDIDKEDEQENTEATYDENPNTDQTTDQRTQQNDTSHDYNATEGLENSSEQGSAQNGTSTGSQSGTDTSQDGSQSNSKTSKLVSLVTSNVLSGDDDEGDDGGDVETPGDNDQGGSTGTGGPGGPGSVYNDDEYTDLPTDTRTVAAVGQYALIVQMLTGKGALVAADEEWLSTVRASSAFPDEGLDTVATAWSGDGTSAGSANVDAIIAAFGGVDADGWVGDGCVVLVGSNTSTLTQDECDQLTATGIDVVVMPALGDTYTEDDEITTAVKVVGELLKGAVTQYDASLMVSEYITQHDDALNNTLTANGGYTFKMISGNTFTYLWKDGHPTTSFVSSNRYVTAFIDAWAYFDQSSVTFHRSFWGQSIYLDGAIGDISDGVGLSQIADYGGDSLLQYYLQHAGVQDNATDYGPVSYARLSVGGTHFSGSGVQYVVGSGSIETGLYRPLFFYLINPLNQAYNYTLVGDVNYPALITRNTTMAQRVTTSANKVNGYYNMGQPYEVWVMPSGLAGSWVDGNVESFLSAPWAYCMFQQGKNLSACTTYVNDFYSTFYRCGAADIVQDYGTVYTATCPQG